MLNAAFLHDTETDSGGSAELTIRTILQANGQHDVNVVYDPLKDFKKTKQRVLSSDFVIVNSTFKCSYEFLLIEWLINCGKPYIKVEHDYNFCQKRSAACFINIQVRDCCNPERFTAYHKLFSGAVLSVFTSLKRYQLHYEIYGEAIQDYFISLLHKHSAGTVLVESPPSISESNLAANSNPAFYAYPLYDDFSVTTEKEIADAPHVFWQKVKESIATVKAKQRFKNVLIYKSFGGLGDFLFCNSGHS